MFGFLRRKEKIRTGNDQTNDAPEQKPCFLDKEPYFPLIEVAPQETQRTSRGTKTQFSDNLEYNLSIFTRRIPSEDLVCQRFTVGSLAKKEIVIIYLKNIANHDIVAEVRGRIRAIKAPSILESSYVERNIEDSNMSPFPQIENTKKPDVAESALLQGRVAIIVSGSPDILLVPTTFFDLMDTPDDAYLRWPVAATFFRLARFISLVLAASLPGFYIALTSFNPELIPTKLLFEILATREETPFPIYFEVFLMMGVIEAIRMMMIRIPSQIGSTLAVVSGVTLVIAGLFANVIGPIVIIVSTLTMIASFNIPDYQLRSSIRLIQFFTMIMSSVFGIFGYAVAFFYIAIHLSTLKSFGISYMAPFAPLEGSGWGHTIFRENTETMPQDETYQPLVDKTMK
jgi:hypothetical protein